MPSTRCLKCLYFLAITIVLALVATIVLVSYSPLARNLLRSQLSRSDVVVVGGGLAGLSAAIEASNHGARVTIIEKTGSLGGNSAKATSGINGVGSGPQVSAEIDDSLDAFIADTIKSGGGLSKSELVNILVKQSASAIEFLMSFGLNLTDVIQLGGHSNLRTHRIPPTPDGRPIPVGFTIVSALRKHVENELVGAVNVIVNAKFTSLKTDDKGKVTGVMYETSEGIKSLSGTVILTAGGYANDHTDSSLLEKHVPQLSNLPTTNGAWATGDILKATEGNGLSLVHMDQVQVHPTGFIEPGNPKHHTKFLAPESLRGCGAILLNNEGKRFVNELGRRDHVTAAIFEKCGHFKNDPELPVVAVMLMNDEIINKFGRPAAGFYIKKEIIKDVGSLENLAKELGQDVSVLSATISSYQTAAGEGEDEFGKVTFVTSFSPKDHFYIAYITPALHYCMGGLEISERGEVLRAGGQGAQPGLYAAGEVTGGVHGMNRLGGNSLLDCVVYGRIAGENAAHYQPNTNSDL